MAKVAPDTPLPPVMLLVLPPDLAQIVVDRLLEDDRTLKADMAEIRARYEPRCLPTSSRPRRPQPKAA
jgi:hypothetical protein